MKLVLHTKDKLSHTSTANPTWELANIYEYNYVKVSQFIVPNVFSSFDSTNNFITLNGIIGNISTQKRYSTMASCISDLNNAVPTVPNLTSFIFSFNQDLGTLKITYTATASILMKANERLGLLEDLVLSVGTNQTRDLPNIFSLSNTNVIYVCINGFTTNDSKSSLLFGNILATIPLTEGFGGLTHYQDTDESSYIQIEGTDSISTINLSFKDSNGMLVDLKNQHVVVELLFKK